MNVRLGEVLLSAALAAAPGIAQIRAVTSLPEPVLATFEEVLTERLPDVEVRWVRRGGAELWDSVIQGRAVGGDLLVGVDAQSVDLIDEAGGLLDLGVALPAGMSPLRVDPGGRYVVPWADAYVVARDPRFFGEGVAPRTLDAMTAGDLSDRLVLPGPAAAPSLFVEWIRAPLRDGLTTDSIFASLLAVDARVRAWGASAEEVVAALVERPGETFVVAPLSVVRAAPGALAFEPLEPFTPLLGHAVAVPRDSGDPALARRVLAVLLAPELACELAAEHGLLPGIDAVPEGAAAVPEFVRKLIARAAPVDPERDYVGGWFRRFESEVRGEGRYSDRLGVTLEVVFGLLFLAAMYWIYRRSQVTDA